MNSEDPKKFETNTNQTEQSLEAEPAEVEDLDSTEENIEREVTSEELAKAEDIVLDTLELGPNETLDDFKEKLFDAVKKLPRYQEIIQEIEGVETDDLAHEIFNNLKREADTEEYPEDAPKDGVLVKSMREGKLECAGRSLLASTLLREKGIEHSVVTAPGHSFVLIEKSPDTLVYFDANNNLYFTFPKEALQGYKGADNTAECKLADYTPRETDELDGVNTVFRNFVVSPSEEGVGRQYLGNVKAALSGNEEFKTTQVEKDPDLEFAVDEIENNIYGESPVLEDFYSRVDGLVDIEEAKTVDDKNVLTEIMQTNPNREDFIPAFINIFSCQKQERVPYLKGLSDEAKAEYAGKVWDKFSDKGLDQTISGR